MDIKEYIKRKQRMGFRGDDLVYKVPQDQPAPVVTEEEPVVPVPTFEE